MPTWPLLRPIRDHDFIYWSQDTCEMNVLNPQHFAWAETFKESLQNNWVALDKCPRTLLLRDNFALRALLMPLWLAADFQKYFPLIGVWYRNVEYFSFIPPPSHPITIIIICHLVSFFFSSPPPPYFLLKWCNLWIDPIIEEETLFNTFPIKLH